jgi:hypothetical protein
VSEIAVVPRYPGAVALNGQASPGASRAGGGMLQNWASDDPPEAVAAFYGERLGAGVPAPGAPWPAAWHLSAPDGSEHHVEVWPADGAYPFRDDVVAPPPPGARTVVHESSYVRAAIEQPRPPAPGEPSPVATRWSPPATAWLLALLSIAVLVLLIRYFTR